MNSKFKKQPPLWIRSGRSYMVRTFNITSWNNFTAVKINEAVGKRFWKVSKIITSICIPSSERFTMFIIIRVLRLRSTDRKSPLTLTRHTNIKSYHSFQSLSLHAAWILQMQVFWVLTKVLPTSGQLQPEMDWREGHICAFPFVPHVQWRTKNWHRCRCMVSFKLLLCPFQVSPEQSLISFDTSNNKTKKIDKQKKTQPSGPSCSKAG